MPRKIVCLCGSMRFAETMQQTAERLELDHGWVVLTPVLHALPRPLTQPEAALLADIHRAKIALADAVYIVNPGGYIGEAVRAEIAYAQSLGKEIIYMEA